MKLFWMLFFLSGNNYVLSQDNLTPKAIRDEKVYLKSISGRYAYKAMVSIKTVIPGITIDLRYATSNNFTGNRLYTNTTNTYLRRNVARKLAAVQKQLQEKGLGLKIFDAYRPWSVTQKIWEMVKDERYAADPSKGSNHNRGIAVDVTIINLQTKEELDMGTGFDNFSDTAHHNFKSLPDSVLRNRLLLKSVMEKNGFTALETEWWHYSLPGAEKYELLDLGFEQFQKLQGSRKAP